MVMQDPPFLLNRAYNGEGKFHGDYPRPESYGIEDDYAESTT